MDKNIIHDVLQEKECHEIGESVERYFVFADP
jgi:hypothetical protein